MNRKLQLEAELIAQTAYGHDAWLVWFYTNELYYESVDDRYNRECVENTAGLIRGDL